MKILTFEYLFFLLFNFSKEKKPISEYNNISPEKGYISDNEILSENKCFKPIKILLEEKISDYLFMSPQNFKSLIKNFGISTLNNRYQFILKSDLLMDYFNEIYEDIYSLSLNYQISAVETKNFIYEDEDKKPSQIGLNILTKYGLKIYQKNKKEFRLICGDRLINTFYYGVFLLSTVKITFVNPVDKINLLNYMKVNKIHFGKFDNVIEKIYYIIKNFDNIIDKDNIYIEVFAFQLGDDIKNINFLNKKDFYNGNFTIINCQLKNYHSCIYGTNLISEYINNSYYKIWKHYRNNSLDNLYVMGAVHKHKNKDILKEFNIYVNESFINEEIINKRNYYLSFMKEFKLVKKNLENYKKIKQSYFNQNHILELYNIINDIYYNIFYRSQTAIECYRNVKEFLICSENIISDINNKLDKYKKIYKTIVNENSYYKIDFNNNFCLPKKVASWKKKNMYLKILKFPNEVYILEYDNTNFLCSNIENNSFICKDKMIKLNFNFAFENKEIMLIKCIQIDFNYIEEKRIEIFIP